MRFGYWIEDCTNMDLSNYKIPEKSSVNSERAEILKIFVDRINSERKEAGYKKLPARVIAIKTSHLDLWDLKVFLGQCKEAKNFGAYFFFALRPRS